MTGQCSTEVAELTHDSKGIHVSRLCEAAIPECLWRCVHDGAHMVASWHMLLALQQWSAKPCFTQPKVDLVVRQLQKADICSLAMVC